MGDVIALRGKRAHAEPETRLERIAARAGNSAPQQPLVAFIASLHGSPATRKTMMDSLDTLATLLLTGAKAETVEWHLLSRTHVDALVTRMVSNGYADATVNRCLSALRGVVRAAWGLKLISHEECERICSVRGPKSHGRPLAGRLLGLQEIRALYAACAADASAVVAARDACLVTLAYCCGMRREEMARITLGAIEVHEVAVDGASPVVPARAAALTPPGATTRAEKVAPPADPARADELTSPMVQTRAEEDSTPADVTRAARRTSPVGITRAEEDASPAVHARADKSTSPAEQPRAALEASPVLGARAVSQTSPVTEARAEVAASPEMIARPARAQRLALTFIGKGNKTRTVHLSPTAARHVVKWLELRRIAGAPDELIAPLLTKLSTKGKATGPLTPAGVYHLLEKLGRSAHLHDFSPHDVRRTFITTLLDKNVDVLTVARLAGHEDPKTTMRYDRRGQRALAQAADTLGAITLDGLPIVPDVT